jgi:2-polyprenyl-3-methyl-5-hydroxy-6-metoxy-1,4-benzoquinol methylase
MPISAGAILDIGCGDSLFLSEAQKRGFEVWGVDFNRRVIEKDRALLRLNNLFPMSIYEFARQADIPKFDLVTFFEVLEHMEDPRRFIGTIRNLLKENAFIAFCLPDSNMFGPCERKLNTAPYHTAYWTDKTVRTFLAKNDFEIVMMKRIHRPDTLMLMVNMLTRIKLIKESSIVSFMQDIGSSMTHQSANYAVRAAIFLLQCLSLPLRELLYVVGRRPVIYGIARRRG